jgi:hypothetical protein
MRARFTLFIALVGAAIALTAASASACGGFFCQNLPVDQVGERIVFTVNPDETITTLIEIQYQGEADDFSWILPIPEAIDAEALQVPEDGELVFDELHTLTDVQIIAPEMPDCASTRMMDMAASAAMEDSGDSGVDIFASGEVGPFGFDVVGSEDPGALVTWLRDNNYQVTNDMIPLIDVYVDGQMAFVAMRLLDGETADSIQPIEITYGGTEPMIPLRLTAVAALPNMPIWVWIFGEHQAVSTNFTNMEIADEEISFFPFGGNDYTFLVQQRANALDGHAFITEYAQSTSAADFDHPWLTSQAEGSPYLTRLNTYIDPEEMTMDPTFGFDPSKDDVSNIRDLSDLDGLYQCQRAGEDDGFLGLFGGDSDAIDPMDGTAQVVAFTPGEGEEATSDTAIAPPVDLDPDTDDDADENAAPLDEPASSSSGRAIVLGALAALGLLGLAFAYSIRRSA